MSEMPLEASWELPDLTTPEEDPHHEEDLPSDNMPSLPFLPPPPVPPSDEEEEEEHPSSTETPEHAAMNLSITSITLDDMPTLPPPPPPSFLPSDKEEDEEGEQTQPEGTPPAGVNPSLKKIESILQAEVTPPAGVNPSLKKIESILQGTQPTVETRRQDSGSEQVRAS